MRWTVAATVLALGGCSGLQERGETQVNTHRLSQAKAAYEAAREPLGQCTAAKQVALAYQDLGSRADAEVWALRERDACRAAYAAMGLGAVGE